jgi:Outer membrane lipoprotein-sorting protein
MLCIAVTVTASGGRVLGQGVPLPQDYSVVFHDSEPDPRSEMGVCEGSPAAVMARLLLDAASQARVWIRWRSSPTDRRSLLWPPGFRRHVFAGQFHNGRSMTERKRRITVSIVLRGSWARWRMRMRRYRANKPSWVRPQLMVSLLTTCAAGLHGPEGLARAEAASDDARAIIAEAQRRSETKSQRYQGLVQVFDARGKVSDKRWTFERLGAHGQSKSVLRFTAPPEVKGVALLVINHPDRASDQWMWTPALERDRRIALQDRSTRFFGTDFSFEDLEERDVNQYDYRMLGEEVVDGVPCWRIESIPKPGKSSQYTRSIAWVRKVDYVFARLENHIRDQIARRLSYLDIQNIQGIWTARQLEMADLRRKSLTRLTLDKLEYNVPLNEGDFTLQAIRRQ